MITNNFHTCLYFWILQLKQPPGNICKLPIDLAQSDLKKQTDILLIYIYYVREYTRPQNCFNQKRKEILGEVDKEDFC